jgi:hypothetical protein
MGKTNNISNPTILTALRLWWRDFNKSELKLSKKKHEFSDGVEFIVSILAFTLLTFNFMPKVAVEADIVKDNLMFWLMETPEPRPQLDRDLQKSTDNWKHNPKTVYTHKSLTVQNTIWQYLTINMGLPDIAAAGVFGNMMVESGSRTFNVNPYIYSPGQAYYGLCQWNTGGHHSSINGGTLEEQLEYLADTIESEMHSSNYQRFLNAETPEQASVIFGQWYERCATPDSRQNEARRAYERFGG